MTGSYASRIRELRERSGRSPADLATALAINLPWYYDVEACDDETTTGLSLRQLYVLAHELGVTLRQLLAAFDGAAPVWPQGFSFMDLASRLRSKVDAVGIEPVEDAVGWRLEAFLTDPAQGWDQPLDFLRSACGFLGIDWIEAVPADEVIPTDTT